MLVELDVSVASVTPWKFVCRTSERFAPPRFCISNHWLALSRRIPEVGAKLGIGHTHGNVNPLGAVPRTCTPRRIVSFASIVPDDAGTSNSVPLNDTRPAVV